MSRSRNPSSVSSEFDEDICHRYPSQLRQNSFLGTSARQILKHHLLKSKSLGVPIQKALKRWRDSQNFSHPTMRACSEFLRVMGHSQSRTVLDVFDILSQQLQIGLNHIRPEDVQGLFRSAREAAIFLEIPRLRAPAVSLLQVFCSHMQLPIDQIDNDTQHCCNCGGNCNELLKFSGSTQSLQKQAPTCAAFSVCLPQGIQHPISSRYDDTSIYCKPYNSQTSHSYQEKSHKSKSKHCIDTSGLIIDDTIEPKLDWTMDFNECSGRISESSTSGDTSAIASPSALFVSSTFSNSLLKYSLLCRSIPLQTSSAYVPAADDEVHLRARRDAAPHDSPEAKFINDHFKGYPSTTNPSVAPTCAPIIQRRRDDCWEDMAMSDTFFGDGASDTPNSECQDDLSPTSINTPQSLMRVIAFRCRCNEDLYAFCRKISPLSFRKYLWPHSSDWLLNDLLRLIQVFSLRLRATALPPLPSTSDSLSDVSAIDYHHRSTYHQCHLTDTTTNLPLPSSLNNYSTHQQRLSKPVPPQSEGKPIPHQSEVHIDQKASIDKVAEWAPELIELTSIVSSSPLAYRLVVSVLERLMLYLVESFNFTSPINGPYSVFDPHSRPVTDVHDIIWTFLSKVSNEVQVASTKQRQRSDSNTTEPNGAVESTTQNQEEEFAQEIRMADIPKFATDQFSIPDYHIASIRVHLLCRLEKEHPSLPQTLDPLGWTVISAMEALITATSLSRGSTLSSSITVPPASPRLAGIRTPSIGAIDQCITSLKNISIHSLHDLLTISFLLMHPPYLLLLSEQSQIFQSQTDLIAPSSQKSTETLLGFLLFRTASWRYSFQMFSPTKAFEADCTKTLEERRLEPSWKNPTGSFRIKRSHEGNGGKACLKLEPKRFTERHPLKRRRKSLSFTFEFDVIDQDQLLPSRTFSSAPAGSIETYIKDRNSQTGVTLGTIIQHLRLIATGPPPSAPPHTISLLRDIRDCFPRFRPITFRFIRMLNRALGTHIQSTVASTPSAHSAATLREQEEVEERDRLFNRICAFFKAVALGIPKSRTSMSDTDTSASAADAHAILKEVIGDSSGSMTPKGRRLVSESAQANGQLPQNPEALNVTEKPESPSAVLGASTAPIVNSSETITKLPQLLDRRFLKLLLSGLLRCGLTSPQQRYLIDFVLKASPFLDGEGLLVQDSARFFCDPDPPFSIKDNAQTYLRAIMRRIALPPSEQQLFNELFEFWKSHPSVINFVQQPGKPTSSLSCRNARTFGIWDSDIPLPSNMSSSATSIQPMSSLCRNPEIDIVSVTQLLLKRVLRLCHVKCLIRKASELGLTVVDAHDRECFEMARQFVQIKINQLISQLPAEEKPQLPISVQLELNFWKSLLDDFSSNNIILGRQTRTHGKQERLSLYPSEKTKTK